MGQQQLLLLVLGIVLVGIAVVIGIAAFQENTRKSEIDRLTVEAHRVAATAYAWKQTPRALGGGQRDRYYDTLTLEALGFDGVASDQGGERQNVTRGGVNYRLVRRELPRTHIHVVNEAMEIGVAVFLLGPEPDCFAYRMNYEEGGRTIWVPGPTPPLPDGCSGW